MMGGIRITNKQTERGALMPMSQSDIAIACSKFDNGDDFNVLLIYFNQCALSVNFVQKLYSSIHFCLQIIFSRGVHIMKKTMRIISVMMAIVLIISSLPCVMASNVVPDEELAKTSYQIETEADNEANVEITAIENDLSDMSIEELNDYIHSLYLQSTASGGSSERAPILSAAWIAAAEIAGRAGFPCAAAIVKSSARGQNYVESNGLLANKIKTTKAYAEWVISTSTYITFEKSDNADLFYAIHHADVYVTGGPSGARQRFIDTFDFKFETDMQDLFSTLVNDWAWLSQNIGALSPIRVQVDITT